MRARPAILSELLLSALLLMLLPTAYSVNAYAETRSSLTVNSLDGKQLPATLIKPDGDGPFPAVVIVHDCSGLGPRSSGAPMRWAGELVSEGYVVLVPDSFSPRGFADGTCTLPGTVSNVANGTVRAADAYGALAALRALPYVNAKRVGIMGGSHGGWTTLAAMVESVNSLDLLAGAKRDGFASAVALYPACARRYGHWEVQLQNGNRGPIIGHSGAYKPIAPLLILIGEKDDWTPAEPCRQLVDAARAAGHPIDIKIYPGVHHSFDNNAPVRYSAQRTNGNSPTGQGATTGGDPYAWADAKKEVASFFAAHLKQ